MAHAVHLTIAVLALAASTCAQAPQPGATAEGAGTPIAQPPRMTLAERFPDLDAYLAFLEKRSHLGGAWYREVAPDRFALQTPGLRTDRDASRQRVFTRKELEKKFGFAS